MSIWHWLVVLVIVMLFFGPKRLGEVGKGLGQGVRGLREGLTGKDPEGAAGTSEPAAEKADTK